MTSEPKTLKEAWDQVNTSLAARGVESSDALLTLQTCSRWTLRQVKAFDVFLSQVMSGASATPGVRVSKFTSTNEAITALKNSETAFYKTLKSFVCPSDKDYPPVSIGSLFKWYGFDLSDRVLLTGQESMDTPLVIRLENGYILRQVSPGGAGSAKVEKSLSLDAHPRDLPTIIRPYVSFMRKPIDRDFASLLDMLNFKLNLSGA